MIGAFAKANVASVFPSFTPPLFPRFLMTSSLYPHPQSEFTASSKLVAAWDFDRMIPCHGDVMETGAKKAWTDTYADILSKA